VADDNYIGVAPNHPGHIRDALPFSQRGCLGVYGTDDAASQSVHGGLKRQARSGAGFEKEAGHNLAAAELQLFRR